MIKNSRHLQLEFRRKKFYEFTNQITFDGVHIAEGLFLVDLPKNLYENMVTSTVQFLSKIYKKNCVLLTNDQIQKFNASRDISFA